MSHFCLSFGCLNLNVTLKRINMLFVGAGSTIRVCYFWDMEAAPRRMKN
jgi:hypothetical protein